MKIGLNGLWRPFGVKVALSVATVSAIAVLVLAAAFGIDQYKRTRDQVFNENLQLARVLSLQLSGEVQGAMRALAGFAGSTDLLPTSEAQAAAINTHLESSRSTNRDFLAM